MTDLRKTIEQDVRTRVQATRAHNHRRRAQAEAQLAQAEQELESAKTQLGKGDMAAARSRWSAAKSNRDSAAALVEVISAETDAIDQRLSDEDAIEALIDARCELLSFVRQPQADMSRIADMASALAQELGKLYDVVSDHAAAQQAEAEAARALLLESSVSSYRPRSVFAAAVAAGLRASASGVDPWRFLDAVDSVRDALRRPADERNAAHVQHEVGRQGWQRARQANQ